MSNKDLAFEFDKLNTRFFNGKINAGVKFDKLGTTLGNANGPRADGSSLIKINTLFKRFYGITRTTLLHEMVHVKLDSDGYVGYPADDYHGARFHVEIDRLYKLGAYDGEL